MIGQPSGRDGLSEVLCLWKEPSDQTHYQEDNMKTLVTTLAAVSLSLAATTATAAGDVAAGKAKAAMCAACHGMNGISTIPMYPKLAGQHAQYLADSLKAFRDGRRKSPLMEPMAKGLSDYDISNLAAYFASLPSK